MKYFGKLFTGLFFLLLLSSTVTADYDVLQPREVVEGKCNDANTTVVNAPSKVYLNGEQVETVNCSSLGKYEFGQVSENPWSNYLSLQEFMLKGVIPSLAILLFSLETLRRTDGLEDRQLNLSLKALAVTSILALTYLFLDLTTWSFMTNPGLISQIIAAVALISPLAVGSISPLWITYREDERRAGLKKASIPVSMTFSLIWLILTASRLSPAIFGATA
ncbi:MAG: hypothetical protein ABEK00_02910 [Candidatus Nanohaloarchaea archaeon]